MKPIFIAFALLLCTGVRAQNTSTVQKTVEIGTNYTYTLRTDRLVDKEVLMAFGEAAGLDVNARFSGDWTTTDDDGIEYQLNTRRNKLSIKYRGKDEDITAIHTLDSDHSQLVDIQHFTTKVIDAFA